MTIDTAVKRYAFLRLLPPPTGVINSRDERGLFLRLFPEPEAASGANSPIPAFLLAMKSFYENSPSFLTWIQSVKPAGATSGNIFLGKMPLDLPDTSTEGPIVLIAWENLRLEQVGGARGFYGQIDITADHIWTIADIRTSDTFVEEMDFLDRIFNEVAAIGLNLDSVFGGHIVAMSASNSLEPNPHNETEWHCPVAYTVGFGHDG